MLCITFLTAMHRAFVLGALFCLLLPASGCGTVFNGTRQNVPMYSTPEGAEIIINGVSHGTTPAAFRLKRGVVYVVEFKREGYEDVVTVLNRKLDIPPFAINILTTVYAGVLVDFVTGAAYYVEPGVINVALPPLADDEFGVVLATPEAPATRVPQP